MTLQGETERVRRILPAGVKDLAGRVLRSSFGLARNDVCGEGFVWNDC